MESVDEYVDDLASGSEDEKRLKKAKYATSRKRRQPTQGRSGPGKVQRIFDFEGSAAFSW